MFRWTTVAGVYGLLGLAAGSLAYFWRSSPWEHPDPWLALPPFFAHSYSALLGITLGLTCVALSRFMVQRTHFGRVLHAELRPLAGGLSGHAIVLLAVFSSFGEEFIFRALLQPATGVLLQALIFGFLHQIPGRARWIWAAWATMMGLALGALFAATGSLLGPLLAHALVNGLNLRFLQAHDTTPPPRSLGGILQSPPPR